MKQNTYEYSCPKCDRVFTSTNELMARFAQENHTDYCLLPTKYKVLQVILFPLGFVGMACFLFGALAYLSLAPVAYPFILATSLLLDNKIYTWDEFKDFVYGDDRLKTFKKKL